MANDRRMAAVACDEVVLTCGTGGMQLGFLLKIFSLWPVVKLGLTGMIKGIWKVKASQRKGSGINNSCCERLRFHLDCAEVIRRMANIFLNFYLVSWKSHNDFIFNNTSRSSHELIASTLAWLKSFGFSGNMEQLVCFSKTEQRWPRPKLRWLKINVNGSMSMIVEGLKLVWSKGFKQVEVDCDNAMLIDTIQNGFALINNIEEVQLIHELCTKD
ncbi:hypothetical protein Godav_029630 [Gossypium davidsonii]|uniref:RNase H type-1 domain-containing protein n=1 Tax=Gossypium davidsonii TaxID=34287 RepID=A0A7J8T689_GOSDV|nr:hypothetical protein [Gossypium davidsonii]